MFEAWTLRQESVNADDEKLRSAVRALTDPQRAEFFKQYNKALKDPDTFAVLNWFFLAGLHHFYLGRFIRGSLNLLIMALGIVLLFSTPTIGSVLIAGIILIEIPALFRSQIIVENYNTNLGRRILNSQQ
ncbi:MAG: TM2 domain-containing membrane protein YozV [Pseudohongiellaceae bacterium]|jgi:TM2 domain-containing membrane protein YozV